MSRPRRDPTRAFRDLPLSFVADALAPGLPVAHAIGRLGNRPDPQSGKLLSGSHHPTSAHEGDPD